MALGTRMAFPMTKREKPWERGCMFLWYPVLDLARAPRRTARKKGSGYENETYRENPKCRILPHFRF